MAFLFSDAVLRQTNLYDKFKKIFSNFEKNSNITIGSIQAKLLQLDNYFSDYKKNDIEIKNYKADANKDHPYFSLDEYSLDAVEDLYYNLMGQFLELKDEISRNASLNSSQLNDNSHDSNATSNSRTVVISNRRLPPIPIPNFNGDFKEWVPFRDLFQEVVVKSNYSSAEKLTFLKNSLKNEPLLMIKNLSVTEGQFETEIWQKLLNRYNNDKIIIYSHVNNLLNLKPMTIESDAQLRKLINETISSVESLRMLDAPVAHWDYLLVPMTVNRLDNVTRRDWEDLTGDDAKPATFDQLQKFLERRLRTLDSVQRSSNCSRNFQNKDNSQGRKDNFNTTNPKSNTIKAHNSNKVDSSKSSYSKRSIKCYLCNDNHFISYCNVFKEKSPSERYDFVLSSKLCHNCLGKHLTKDCRIQKTCTICRSQHHTLIHDSCSKSTNNQTSSESAGNSNTF